MPELQFDAVLMDQITPKLKEIADSLKALVESAQTVSKDFQTAFDDMSVAVYDFQNQVEKTQGAVESAFAGMGTSITDFKDALVTAAAPMQAFNEQLVLFTDEASTNFASGMKADVDAMSGFASSTKATMDSIAAESDSLTALGRNLGTIAEQKIATSGAEDTLAGSSRAAVLALSAEASASASASASIATEAKVGRDSAPARSGGYGSILGATMMLGLAGAMAKVGINMIKSGIQSDNAMNHIIALADQSTQNFATYQNGLKSLAISTGKTLDDLSAGLYDIVSVGIKGSDSLLVLAAAAKAAAAGGGDLHDVTNGLSSILIGYGLHAKDAAEITNALVIAVRDGKAEFPDFSRAIGLVGNAAKTSGISFQEASAALSVMSLTFPSTRQAGQDLQHLLNELGINAAKVEKRAEGMGHGFNLAKFEAMPLIDRLHMLSDIAGGDQGKMETLVGGLTSMKAVMALTANGGQAFIDTLTHMQTDTGALSNAFQIHGQTIEFQIDRMKAAVSVLSADLAELAKPVLVGAFTILADVIGHVADLFEKHANVMTPLVIMLALAISGLLVGAIVSLSVLLADMMGPAIAISFAFAGISMAIGGLIGWFINAYNQSAPLRDALNQLGAAVGQLWMGIKPLVDTVLGMFVTDLQQLATWLGIAGVQTKGAGDKATQAHGAIDLLVGIVKGLTTAVQSLANWLAPVTTDFGNIASSVTIAGKHMHDFAGELDGAKKPMLDNQKQAKNFADLQKDLKTGVQGSAGALIGLGSSALFALPALILGKERMIEIASAVYRATGTFLGWLPSIQQVAGAIVDFISGALDILLNPLASIRSFIGFVSTGFQALGTTLAKIATGGAGAIIDALSTLVDTLAADVIPAVVGFIAAAAPFVAIALAIAAVVVGVVVAFQHWYSSSAQFRAMIGELLKQLLSVWTFLQAQFKPVWADLVNTFKTQLVPILGSLQSTWKAIQPALLAIGAVVMGILVVAFGLLISIVKAVIAALAPLIGGVFQALVGAFKFVVGVIQLVITVVGGLISLIVDLIFNQKNLGKDLANIWQGIKDAAGNIFGGLGGMIQGIFGGFIHAVMALVGTFIGSIIDFFSHLFEKLVGHSIVPDMIKGIIEWFLKLPIEILQMVGQFVVNLISTFLSLATKIILTIAEFVIKMVALWQALGNMILSAVIRFVEGVVQRFLSLGTRILIEVGMFVIRVVTFFKALGTMILATIVGFVENVVNSFISLGVRILTAVADFVLMVIAYWNMLTSAVLAEIQAWVSRVINFFIDLGARIISTVINFVMSVVDHFVQLGLRVLAAIELLKSRGIQVFNEYKDLVIGIVKNFINNIITHFNDLKAKVGTAVQNALDLVKQKFSDAIHLGETLINQIAQGIKNAIPNMLGAVTGGLQKLRNLFPHSPAKEGPLTTAPGWGGTLMQQVTDGISNNTGKVVAAARNVAGQLAGTLGNVQATGGIGLAGTGAVALGANGVPAQLGGAAPGTGTVQHQEIHVHLDGGIGTGLSMINATDRAKLVQDIAVEMGRQMRLQGRVGTGYSGG